MKKTNLLMLAFLLTAALATSMIGNVKAVPLRSWTWSGAVFQGYDSFYKTWVIAFQENTQAALYVNVRNDVFPSVPINISAVGVSFEWGVKYNSTQMSQASPIQMQHNDIRVFVVTFTVPNSSVVSNQYLHDYTVYVEQVNATTGPKKVVSTWSQDSSTQFYSFAIYSVAQAEAQTQAQLIDSTIMPTFNSTSAKLSWDRAINETVAGGLLYNRGDFVGAKAHYDQALSLMNSAFTAEETKGTSFENAQLALLLGQAHWFEAQVNYSNGLANMWILIGVAAILFAIGYIIRGVGSLRKPPATT